jgi:biotin carboxyl carrier protein
MQDVNAADAGGDDSGRAVTVSLGRDGVATVTVPPSSSDSSDAAAGGGAAVFKLRGSLCGSGSGALRVTWLNGTINPDDSNGQETTFVVDAAMFAGLKAGDPSLVQVWPGNAAGLGDRQSYAFHVPAPDFTSTAAGGKGGGAVKAPMPGKVLKIMVKEGDKVEEGQPLVILEAMKMEHVVCALRAGVVGALHASEGSVVSDGAVLAELVAEEAGGAAQLQK